MDDPHRSDWEAQDAIVQAWLLKLVALALSSNLEFLETAKSMWDTLDSAFSTKGSIAYTKDIFGGIMKMRDTASPFHVTFLQLQKLGNLLDQYQPITTDPAI